VRVCVFRVARGSIHSMSQLQRLRQQQQQWEQCINSNNIEATIATATITTLKNNHGPHVQKLFSIETKDKQEASVAQKERR